MAPVRYLACTLAVFALVSGCAAGQQPVPVARSAAVLPWPAPEADDAAALQHAADSGTQPWLLDPTELAISYTRTTHGWPAPEARPGADAATVEVRNTAGEHRVLTLAQPGRAGQGGIWVVIADVAVP